ncbi:MAG: CHC2 zinc finger domain-containing protein, partial [Campylobacter upsaliensis]
MIAKDSIELLSQRADILSIISHFVQVRRSGASYVCVCPFHDDRNPSLHINTQKNFYHCFGCGAGGDVFKFVMDFERVN